LRHDLKRRPLIWQNDVRDLEQRKSAWGHMLQWWIQQTEKRGHTPQTSALADLSRISGSVRCRLTRR
jgi:hypothetical protein